MKGVKRLWIVAVTMVASLGVLGVAHAAGAPAKAEMKTEMKTEMTEGGLNMPAPGMAPAPALVPATAAGMPQTSQVLWAVMNSNGTRARSFGTTASARLGVGVYTVTFNHNVAGCAFVGTIGLPGNVGVSPPGEITVVTSNANANAVFVTTHNSAGAAADRSFHLVIAC